MLYRKIHTIILLVSLLAIVHKTQAGQADRITDQLKAMITRVNTDPGYCRLLMIKEPVLLAEFYENNGYRMQWYGSVADSARRNKLLILLAEPGKYMLENGEYDIPAVAGKKTMKRPDSLYAEIRFTDAALHFMKDIAYTTMQMVEYNGLEYQPDCIAIASMAQKAITETDFDKNIKEIEPENRQYRELKLAYQKLYSVLIAKYFSEVIVDSKLVSASNTKLVSKLNQLGYAGAADTSGLQIMEALLKFQRSHNLPEEKSISSTCLEKLNISIRAKLAELRWNIRWYRWLSCMQNKPYILINIAANRLSLIEYNKEVLTSKVVTGKLSTPTPTQASIIKNVIYYPYWNVPYSIATKEMLPVLKRNPSYLDKLKIEVLQGSHIFNSSASVNWHKYSARYFPFSLRQQPGCHNSLGLVKFDFENPFHTYLHDTNNKAAFNSRKRFLSHGCIRIEKPYELAVALGIPSQMINMDSCLAGMKPQVIQLDCPIPIFVIYATVDITETGPCWYGDAYRKIHY